MDENQKMAVMERLAADIQSCIHTADAIEDTLAAVHLSEALDGLEGRLKLIRLANASTSTGLRREAEQR